VSNGTATVIPSPEERDPRDLLMQMWSPPREQSVFQSTGSPREPKSARAQPRPFMGVALLLRKGDQVLLLKRSASHGEGSWCPPGGYLEFGERPDDAARREAREEVGVEVINLRFLAITNDLHPEGKHHITIFFEGSIAVGEPSLATPSKDASEMGWFSWNCLPTPLFLSLEHLLAGESYPLTEFAQGHRSVRLESRQTRPELL
jgi:8-oxo-dGTP diphosphatase